MLPHHPHHQHRCQTHHQLCGSRHRPSRRRVALYACASRFGFRERCGDARPFEGDFLAVWAHCPPLSDTIRPKRSRSPGAETSWLRDRQRNGEIRALYARRNDSIITPPDALARTAGAICGVPRTRTPHPHGPLASVPCPAPISPGPFSGSAPPIHGATGAPVSRNFWGCRGCRGQR